MEIGVGQPDALAGVLPQYWPPADPSENLDVHNEYGAASISQTHNHKVMLETVTDPPIR